MNEQSLPRNSRAPGDRRQAEHDRSDPMAAGAPGRGARSQGAIANDDSQSARRRGLPERFNEPVDYLVDAGAGESGATAHGAIDVRRWVWLLIKHRWLMAGTVAGFLCLGLVVTF